MWQEDEIARMRQAAAADPAQAVRLCDMLVAAGRAAEGVDICRRLLRDRPDDVELRLALGRALSAAGNLEEAQAALFDAVVRKRRNTLRNIPTTGPAAGDAAAPLAPFANNESVPVPIGPSGTSRHAVPSAMPLTGTARLRIPSAVPAPMPPTPTSRHRLTADAPTGTPRPAGALAPEPVPASGTSRHRLPEAAPPGARFAPLLRDPAQPPPLSRKLPPVGPPSRRPFAPLPPVAPRFPGIGGPKPEPEPEAAPEQPSLVSELLADEILGRLRPSEAAAAPPAHPLAAKLPPRAEARSELVPSGAETSLERDGLLPSGLTPAAASPGRVTSGLGLPWPPLMPLPEELEEPILPLPRVVAERSGPEEPALAEVVLAAAADEARGDAPASPGGGAPALLMAQMLDSGAALERGKTAAVPATQPVPAPALPGPPAAAPEYDLDRVAQRLLGPAFGPSEAVVRIPEAPGRMQLLFDRRRARSFTVLSVALLLIAVGGLVGWATRAATTAAEVRRLLARAGPLSASARYEDDRAARDLYQQALRLRPDDERAVARLAEAEARLSADHGEETEDSAFSYLRRAELLLLRRRHPDPEVLGTVRRARLLLALARGEPCPRLSNAEAARSRDQDGDVAARCAWQRGDVRGARQILLGSQEGANDPRLLLFRGALALSLGELEEADHAYRSVLDRVPQHPRALIGRALVDSDRGQDALPQLSRTALLGPVTESWWYLLYGLRALQEGDRNAAALALDRAQAAWRYDARLALAVGRARLLQGRVSDAETGLRMAQRRSPGDPDLLVSDAEVALAKGYEDKVAAALGAEPNPGPRLLSVLGRAQYMAGSYREAEDTLQRAVKLLPGDLTARSYLLLCHARLHSEREAFQDLQRLTALPLPVTTPHYALALLSYERKDLARAGAEARKALERNPEAAYARALLGRVLREQGQMVPALEELRRVGREAPALVVPHQILGRMYLELGRLQDARAELLRVVASGKQSVEDYVALGEATAAMGLADETGQIIRDARGAGASEGKVARLRLLLETLRGPQAAQAAARQLDQERRTNPRDVPLMLLAATAWLRAGDLRAALEDYELARPRAPLQALLGIGRTQFRLHNFPEAEAAYAAALQQWDRGPYALSDRCEAQLGMARILLVRGNVAEAEKLVTQVLAQDPRSAEAQLLAARGLAERQKLPAALQAAQRAEEMDPGSLEACIVVGDLRFKLGDKRAAKERYQHCLGLNPSSTWAKYLNNALSTIR